MQGASTTPCSTILSNLIYGSRAYQVCTPDLLFSQIAKSYYKSDVFNETDLQPIVKQFSLEELYGPGGKKRVKNIPTYQELEICMIL